MNEWNPFLSLDYLEYQARSLSEAARSYAERIIRRRASLNASKRSFIRRDALKSPEFNAFYSDLMEGRISSVSKYFTEHLPWLFETDAAILPRNRAAFLWALDHCTERPYNLGWIRRPIRSNNLGRHISTIWLILERFTEMAVVDADICDILSGNLPNDAKAFLEETRIGYCAETIAYEVDAGNERLIKLLRASLNCEEGAPDPTHQLILGVLLSHNTELYECLGRLLLAARLQEGLRQSICELADGGTYEGFMSVLRVIDKNDLIRYSSVKRALGTWLGIIADEARDLERVSAKQLMLLITALDSPNDRIAMLESEDNLKVYISLWAEAVIDIDGAIRKVEKLSKTGTEHQARVCAFFALAINDYYAGHRILLRLLLDHPKDRQILAMLIRNEAGPYSYFNQNVLSAYAAGKPEEYTPYYSSIDEVRALYDVLTARYAGLQEKAISFTPCVFNWFSCELNRSDLAYFICAIAVILDETKELDAAIELLPQVSVGRRSLCLEALLSRPDRPTQLTALMSALGDRETQTRKSAFKIVDTLPPDKLDFDALEGLLRYKNADIRRNTLTLLLKQDDARLIDCVRRLLADAHEEKQSAGCDLIMQLVASERYDSIRDNCREALAWFVPNDPKLKLLRQSALDELNKNRRGTDNGLFDESDVFVPDLSVIDSQPENEAAFIELFPDHNADHTGACPSRRQAFQDCISLHALIEERAGCSIGENHMGDEAKLGYQQLSHPDWYKISDRPFPFGEVWEAWYNQLSDFGRFIRVLVLVNTTPGHHDSTVDRLFGTSFSKNADLKYEHDLKMILAYLLSVHSDETKLCRAACSLARKIMELKDDEFIWKGPDNSFQCITVLGEVSLILGFLAVPSAGMETECFLAREALYQRFRAAVMPMLAEGRQWFRHSHEMYLPEYFLDNRVRFGFHFEHCIPEVYDYLRALHRGDISERMFYRMVFDQNNQCGYIEKLSYIALGARQQKHDVINRSYHLPWTSSDARSTLNDLIGDLESGSEAAEELVQLACRVYDAILPVILDNELKRGEAPAKYSKAITSIEYVNGADTLARILTALGNEALERGTLYRYKADESRRVNLCHLLGVCVPAPGDSVESFKRLMKGAGVSEDRLIEVAMYNPAWIELIGDALGIKGFRSAVYYFIAHMHERIDTALMAVIARYTPLTSEELDAGVFDVNWFRSAYAELGEAQFKRLYKAARYISDGSKHMRARRYADAALGMLDIDETESAITLKRNKDLLLAYAAIPPQNEDEILRRYLFINKFIKESRAFGQQRSASERQAGETALINLAVASGYEDVTRLTLRMEGYLSEDSRPLFEPHDVDDIRAYLGCSEKGDIELVCEKDGKVLKSVPSRLKKDEYILGLIENKKALSEQQRRTKRFLEQAMEDGMALSAEEILMLGRAVTIRPVVEKLVYKCDDSFVTLSDGTFRDADAKVVSIPGTQKLLIAHPQHFYNAGAWTKWQRLLFEKHVIQPFKQVFRELYVKTEDEMGKSQTMRYAGHQLQPHKAAALLRTRRWIADPDAGLQKIFYKQNVIAQIYAEANWFSPSDIEAPALEYVCFYDRRNGNPIAIDDIDDILFSEVMRDVDLVVSVAHVGGVDPEASHSTIQMRAALAEYSVKLFKLDNVRIEGSHAMIHGKRADYSVHLGSGVVHQKGGAMIAVLAVPSQHRGRIFLPFADDDPKTAEVLTKILFFAEDDKLRDPSILSQIVKN